MPFDRAGLRLKPLSERIHDVTVSVIKPLEKAMTANPAFQQVARSIVEAKRQGKDVILMMGGHVVRNGVQRYLIDMMERGYLTCVAMNGSVMIHDFEFAAVGATTESVAKYITEGQFGLWTETGDLNSIINTAYGKDKTIGMGRAVGQAIQNGQYPFKEISILAAAYRLNIPATVHVGIGYDIIHEHPNCDGAATGATSYNDFLFFARCVENIEGGVVMNFGSAVMAPEVFLKALSMARNAAHRRGEVIRHFTALVCDIHDVPDDFQQEPSRGTLSYYFRPWKTMLVRTVADGGKSHYVRGVHAETIPGLWTAIGEAEEKI